MAHFINEIEIMVSDDAVKFRFESYSTFQTSTDWLSASNLGDQLESYNWAFIAELLEDNRVIFTPTELIAIKGEGSKDLLYENVISEEEVTDFFEMALRGCGSDDEFAQLAHQIGDEIADAIGINEAELSLVDEIVVIGNSDVVSFELNANGYTAAYVGPFNIDDFRDEVEYYDWSSVVSNLAGNGVLYSGSQVESVNANRSENSYGIAQIFDTYSYDWALPLETMTDFFDSVLNESSFGPVFYDCVADIDEALQEARELG